MPEILTPLQSKFLNNFFDYTKEFYLTGGTALSAFYLKHRYSEDLDFFTQSEDVFQNAEHVVRETSAKLEIEYTPVRITSYFKHYQVGAEDSQLTLHFSRDYSAHIHSPSQIGKVLVDSIEDITANKICAALGRNEMKDLIDLFFLHKAGYSIQDYFQAAQQKDAGLQPETLAYTLSQFDLVEIPSFMIMPLSIEELKTFIETTLTLLIDNSAPPGTT